jgi:acetoin utilization protein AcuB
MEAAEIMQKKVVSMGAASSLLDAASIMHEKNIRHLPIVEHNEIVGILSERDLRGFLEEIYESTQETSDGLRRKNIPIREVMQNKPLAVDPSADIGEVIDLMIDKKVGAVVVADELGQLRGIISYEDILKLAREHLVAL